MLANEESPAEALEGLETHDGWLIQRRLPKPQSSVGGTGGAFSTGYIVVHRDGREGFLKAMDYTRALASADPARELQALTQMYNFERDILSLCREKGCSRVVLAITSGSLTVENARIPVVEYLIFELAAGDVRNQALSSLRSDLPWFIRAIHHTAIGLNQLHTQRVYHQDLKPSNVLVFQDRITKIADLGRAKSESHDAPHDALRIAGDLSYAPPELLYGYGLSDRYVQSRACDMYHLGSMLYFFVTGNPITPDVVSRLREEHRPHPFGLWNGVFRDVLPYVKNGFGECLVYFAERLKAQLLSGLEGQWEDAVVAAISQLCEPDPGFRGHPRNITGKNVPQFSLERYISLFNRLAAEAEYANRRLAGHAV